MTRGQHVCKGAGGHSSGMWDPAHLGRAVPPGDDVVGHLGSGRVGRAEHGARHAEVSDAQPVLETRPARTHDHFASWPTGHGAAPGTGGSLVVGLLAEPLWPAAFLHAAQRAVVIDEAIARLQIAVDDALRVHVRDAGEQLCEEQPDVLAREDGATAEHALQVGVHELADQVDVHLQPKVVEHDVLQSEYVRV